MNTPHHPIPHAETFDPSRLTTSPGARQLRSILRARIVGAGSVRYARLPRTSVR